MAKTLQNKDETITIRVRKATKDRARRIFEKLDIKSTFASFLENLVVLGVQVEEQAFKKREAILKEGINIVSDEKIIKKTEKIDKSKSEGKRLETEADLLIELVRKRTGNRTWGEKLYLYKAGERPITFAEIKQRHGLIWAEVKKEGYDPMELHAIQREETKKAAGQ
jgi:hypothetical protein